MGKDKKKQKKEHILVALPCFQDPYFPGKPSEFGSIISLLSQDVFHEVILIGLSVWKMNTFLTEQYINQHFPNIKTAKILLSVSDTSTYKEIFYALKQTLEEKHAMFSDEKYDINFVLPPSTYGKLLDCWLLLITSLNIQAKIHQIESHYSLEAAASDTFWNKGLDWLGERWDEIREPVPSFDRAPTYASLEPSLIEKLNSGLRFSKSLLILGGDKTLQNKIGRWVHQKTKTMGPFLNIASQQLPNEICKELLFGYKRQVNKNKEVENKGLCQKGNFGTIHMSALDVLPLDAQKVIAKLLKAENALNRFIFSSQAVFHYKDNIHSNLLSQLHTVKI